MRRARRLVIAFGLGAILTGLLAAAWTSALPRQMAEDLLSRAAGRPVRMAALEIDPGRTTRFQLRRLTIAQPDWAGPGQFADIEAIDAELRLLPLLRGRLDFPRIAVTGPRIAAIRRADGTANWPGGATRDPGGARLPLVRSLDIRDGELSLRDAVRRLDFQGSFASRDAAGDTRAAFVLKGQGQLNARPFQLALVGQSLLEMHAGAPWPFDLDVRAGDSHIAATGQVESAFDLGALSADLTLTGPDLADLYQLTGVVLPNTPPYRLKGRLIRDGARYQLAGFAGTVGDSDLSGELTVDAGGERLHLEGDIASRRLDFDDLAALFGAAPGLEAGETASRGQRQLEARLAASGRLLPDAPLRVERMRAMDAHLRYRAAAIQSETLPLTRIALTLALEKGVLTLDPLEFGLRSGAVAGRARLDASGAVPVTRLDLRLSGARIEDFFLKNNAEPALTGALSARLSLTGRGDSVREAAAHADGQLAVMAKNGEIRRAFAELMGINLARGLGLLLSDDDSSTGLSCGIASFTANDGILTADAMALDTGPVLALGEGQLDLRDETLDLRLRGRPKHARLVRLMAPITVGGSLRQPEIGLAAGGAVAQTALAGALGVLLSPLAAILPFLSPGLAEDADCAALLAGRALPAE